MADKDVMFLTISSNGHGPECAFVIGKSCGLASIAPRTIRRLGDTVIIDGTLLYKDGREPAIEQVRGYKVPASSVLKNTAFFLRGRTLKQIVPEGIVLQGIILRGTLSLILALTFE